MMAPGLACFSRRDATITAVPTAVYVLCTSLPNTPTAQYPVLIPIRNFTSPAMPRFRHSGEISSIRDRMAIAALIAANA